MKKTLNKKSRGKQKKHHNFTWELLPPGTLKRNNTKQDKPEQRWHEIQDICSQVMTESKELD